MKVGDMVESPHHTIRGIVVEVESDEGRYDTGPAARIKWFDGDESFEWVKFLRLISESR